jgi:ribose-phosphate pyrophosphokinase
MGPAPPTSKENREIVNRPLELHAFGDAFPLAGRIAEALGVAARRIAVHSFPDEESLVRVTSDGAPRAIVVRSLDHPNPKLVEVLFAADALRRRGVREILLVAPYLGYMRQDRVFREGEAVSQQVVAGLLSTAFDEVLTVEAHLHRIRALDAVFSCRARSISAAPAIAAWCRSEGRRLLLVGPDAESEPWVRSIANDAALPWIVCHKSRHGDREVEVEVPDLAHAGQGLESALVVDDIASSGATLAATTRALLARGIPRVEAIVTHAIFGPGAEDRLRSAGLARILSTDTLSHASNAIGVASLIAEHVDRRFLGDDEPSTRNDDSHAGTDTRGEAEAGG